MKLILFFVSFISLLMAINGQITSKSAIPTRKPTAKPIITSKSTVPTRRPTDKPTSKPSAFPTLLQSEKPSTIPSMIPSGPSRLPTKSPVTINRVCMFSGGCSSTLPCIEGSYCFQTPGYTQCLVDPAKVLTSNCVNLYQNCTTITSCCNPAATCDEVTRLCMPLRAPKCLDATPKDIIGSSVPTPLPLWKAPSTPPSKLPTFSPTISNVPITVPTAIPTFLNTERPSFKPSYTYAPSANPSTANPTSTQCQCLASNCISNNNCCYGLVCAKQPSGISQCVEHPWWQNQWSAKRACIALKSNTAPGVVTKGCTVDFDCCNPGASCRGGQCSMNCTYNAVTSVKPSLAPITPRPTSKPSQYSAQAKGYFSTKGSQIIDMYGNSVRLTGINWLGLDSQVFTLIGLNKRSYKSIIDQMKSLGFNSFRIPISNEMLHISNDSFGRRYINYALNPDMIKLTPLQTLDKFIEYCNFVNMRVIIDRHACMKNGYYSENRWYIPKFYPESKVIADLQMLALRYINYPAMIAIDLWNEPKDTSPWSEWAKGASRLGNAILQINPKLLIIVEGNGVNYWWGGNLQGAAQYPVILSNPQQLVYSAHDYGPSVYNQTWFYAKTFPNNLKDIYSKFWGYLHRRTIDPRPVLIGEFGAPLVIKVEQTWMKTLIKYMDGDYDLNGVNQILPGQQGLSWMYWCVSPTGDTGGIFESDWNTISQIKLSYINGSFSRTTLY